MNLHSFEITEFEHNAVSPAQLDIQMLQSRISKLEALCNELNPYQPLSPEFKKRLREFNIMEFEDPFKITNALLLLLEDSIEQLHHLSPLPQNIQRQEMLR